MPEPPPTSEKPPEINYDVPEWAAKAPFGTHLDVMKGDKVVQKLMIDERSSYIFGRSAVVSDFVIDHESCSRAHAMLVYHGKLARFFLVDLKSTYGTFVDRRRLEGHSPGEMPLTSTFHFGASTRRYKIQDRPKSEEEKLGLKGVVKMGETISVGLPDRQDELDSLTEYNTALNKRLKAPDDSMVPIQKRKQSEGGRVQFNDEEDVINPEDIDPSIGRFRSLVTTAVIPHKRSKHDHAADTLSAIFGGAPSSARTAKDRRTAPSKGADERGGEGGTANDNGASSAVGFAASLGISLQMTAPDVAPEMPTMTDWRADKQAQRTATKHDHDAMDDYSERAHKTYAKEHWPGRM